MFMNLILKDLIVNNKFDLISLLKKVEDAGKLGITRLVVAPTYFEDEPKSSIDEVRTIVNDINRYLDENKMDLKLYSASLVRDNYNSIKQFIDGKLGSINESKYILLDVEESSTLRDLLEIIYEFNLRSYVPIVVAPERIPEITDNYKNIDKLLKEKCLFQLDSASLNEEYGRKVLKVAKKLKKKGVYSFIGYENEIKKEYINKDVEEISKKGLFVLLKNGELNKSSTLKNEKKNRLFMSK